MKIAIFMPNWIGDAVMATPSLRAVRDHFPAAEIVGIMRPSIADVLAGSGLIDRTLLYNPRGKDPSERDSGMIRTLRAERFEIALLLPNSLRTGLLAWLSGASRRIGFSRDWRGLLLTDRIVPKSRTRPNPVLDEYLRLAGILGCDTQKRAMELAILPVDQTTLDEFWKGRWVLDHGNWQAFSSYGPMSSDGRSYVCFNTGGAFGAAKNWPREYFAELARRVAGDLNKPVLVVCGPAERDDARWIAAQARHPSVVSLADAPLSVGLTKAAVRSADLLVTTDSGPRHFAAPFGTPVITLFGPTHIAWSETRYDKAEHLQLKLDCGPCQQRECPLKHHRCLRDLSVDAVFAAVARQLKKHPSVRKAA
jgi:heptosyltransferase-2